MATASTELVEVERKLLGVADAFVKLHQQRTTADYDVAKSPVPTAAASAINTAEAAFRNWEAVKSTPEAQLFLFTFLAKDR